ncbi:CGNR zinc finger domain-containing protein [Nonomuraea sp. NBC_01738]|uniref:CGNR zinc finger domain-containing protein n=1 Tax=Nonomuraea sp. NBC_01738 TaxID=2976003 RepID=UPI002E115D5F|nr:CGNR zinc finger domain-containing protein [Nonomuraea sp. NBC_01738]
MLELVRDFVNTYDVENDADRLDLPQALTAWLHERALIAPGDTATPGDLTTARTLREALRAALRRDGTAPEPPELPLTIRFGATPRPVPIEGGVRGALAAIAAATVDPGWNRLKVCAEESCEWAFIDHSKNRSRSWCSMKVCGNRTKTRAYRARKHGSRHPQGSNTDTV